VRALFLAIVLLAVTPLPRQTPPPLPTVPEHTAFLAEVNAHGDVVRAKSTKLSNNQYINLITYGNVLQMFIKHPDGTADAGLYRVTFDYDPKTQKIARHYSIVSRGGSWANETGAYDSMMQTAKREYQEYQQQQDEQRKNLPPLESIIGATPSPTPHA